MQSSTIAFFLLAGFVIYITMRGELVQYAGVMGIGPDAQAAASRSASSSTPLLSLPGLGSLSTTVLPSLLTP